MQKEFRLEREEAAKLLRDIAEALEEQEQLNMKFGDQKLIQPISGEVPLRVFQDDTGTEIGFKIQSED